MRRRHKSKFDYYHELGVEETSSAQQIKSAYRILAKRFHPDKNNGNRDDEARFKRIAEAYEVLNDPEIRKQYDNYEHPAVRVPPKPGDVNTDGSKRETPRRSPFVEFIKTKNSGDNSSNDNKQTKPKKRNPFTKYQ